MALLPAETAGTNKPAPFAFQPLTALTADQAASDVKQYQQYQKLRLLQSVAGLDRGFAANSTAAALVEDAALALTGTGEAVDLSWTPGELLLHWEPNPSRLCWGAQRCADADGHRGGTGALVSCYCIRG